MADNGFKMQSGNGANIIINIMHIIQSYITCTLEPLEAPYCMALRHYSHIKDEVQFST